MDTLYLLCLKELKEGGGGSAVIDSLIATENGIYTPPSGVDGYNPVTVNVPTGTSNIVTGTFKGTTTGQAIDVPLNYNGNGYIVCLIVFPTGGIDGNSAFSALVQRYAFGIFSIVKRDMSIAPQYNGGDNDKGSIFNLQKNSASSATSYNGIANARATVYNDNSADSSLSLIIRSATKFSTFIADASYGFAANIEYTYYAIYSS